MEWCNFFKCSKLMTGDSLQSNTNPTKNSLFNQTKHTSRAGDGKYPLKTTQQLMWMHLQNKNCRYLPLKLLHPKLIFFSAALSQTHKIFQEKTTKQEMSRFVISRKQQVKFYRWKALSGREIWGFGEKKKRKKRQILAISKSIHLF